MEASKRPQIVLEIKLETGLGDSDKIDRPVSFLATLWNF